MATSSRHSLQTTSTYSAACSIWAVPPRLSIRPPGRFLPARASLWKTPGSGGSPSGPGEGKGPESSLPPTPAHSVHLPSRERRGPGPGQGRPWKGAPPPSRLPQPLLLTFSRRLSSAASRPGSYGGAARGAGSGRGGAAPQSQAGRPGDRGRARPHPDGAAKRARGVPRPPRRLRGLRRALPLRPPPRPARPLPAAPRRPPGPPPPLPPTRAGAREQR